VIKDSKYWLPLLGLYHGNRLEEFAQLLVTDLKEEDGITYFDINDEGGKQVKNEQSKRRVPVHPKLVEMGFLDHIAEIAAGGGEFLFPDLNPGGPDSKRGYYFTKWWTRYRKAIGVYEVGLDYHSFRHGVTTKLYAASVPEAHVDELTGHDGGGTSRRVYKKDMPLKVLHQAVSLVEWPEIERKAK
jgi:integrase